MAVNLQGEIWNRKQPIAEFYTRNYTINPDVTNSITVQLQDVKVRIARFVSVEDASTHSLFRLNGTFHQ